MNARELAAPASPSASAHRDDRQLLAAYIREHCIVDGERETMHSPTGNRYQWAFDFRPLLLKAETLAAVARLFWDEHADLWPFQVAGLELTAIPLVAGIILEGRRRGFDANGLMVRRKRKKYGRERIVEGEPQLDRPAILVDDSVNTARSLRIAVVALREQRLPVANAFAIASFRSEHAAAWMRDNAIALRYLFTPEDFELRRARDAAVRTRFNVKWTFTSPRPNYAFAVAKSQPILHGGRILFGSDAGVLWCLDRASGAVVWSYNTHTRGNKGIISSPALYCGRVFFGAYNGNLYCLDAESGKEVWTTQACDWIGSSPDCADGRVYVGLEYRTPGVGGGLACFDAEQGTRLWEMPTLRMLHGSPAVSAEYGLVVVGTNDGTVLSIKAHDGEVQRLLKVGGPVKARCTLAGDLVVFGSFDGGVYVWDFVRGVVRLRIETEDIVYSRALVCDGRAFVGCADQTLRVIDLTGMTEIACLQVGEKIHSAPTLAGEHILVGTSAGEILAIDRHRLAITHRLQLPERITNAVLWDGETLYAYAYDNKLWALTLPRTGSL